MNILRKEIRKIIKEEVSKSRLIVENTMARVKLPPAAKKFWNTPVKDLTGESWDIHHEIPPSQWDTHPEVIAAHGKGSGIELFADFIRDYLDRDRHLDPKIANMLGLPTNVPVIDYLINGGSGLNRNKYFNKYRSSWGAPLYDIYEEMKKRFGRVSVNESRQPLGRLINEAVVTRIPNFNLESDAYIYMLKLLKNNTKFKKIASAAGIDLFSGANPKNVRNALQLNLNKIVTPKLINLVVDGINQKVTRLTIPIDDIEDGIHNQLFAGILAAGVIDSLVSTPLDWELIKDLGNPALTELANDFSINRGKQTFSTMVQNKYGKF